MRLTAVLACLIGSGLLVFAVVLTVLHFTTNTTKVNPDCTPAAVTALNAYWNAQIANASYTGLQGTISEAIAATGARIKECQK